MAVGIGVTSWEWRARGEGDEKHFPILSHSFIHQGGCFHPRFGSAKGETSVAH